ncbi:DNA polymerase III subunit gamma/tau [Agarilytica rhodophyticola]|uniref:DNA polymerase III subunit gamma/tau n=1 Tax=Agarilytica rhodophyticola TaxID=1737490 RepID=UPI000B34691C|nr:DNA polymerase III subunit gamma/tau [Agarilytica rhodophyticola]
MSYQVLARKWRPRIFREMVGQEHVLQAMINALDHKRLHHAYLFTGTRGVGKTTIARILAKCLNCETGVSSEPCGKCTACREIAEGRFIDLIEVDAASRTKVEDTRELLDNVQYAPTRGRYKIYLIDEVHMLSNHSFNALLKTLEEPPEHVKFLLATTDPQKLPVTILSRCLQFNLKNLSPERIVGHLQHVLTQEMIPFEEAGLWQLARSADGSMRDALSLTDQAVAFGGGKVLETEVASMLGSIDHILIDQIMQAIVACDGKAMLAAVANFADHAPNYDAALADLIALLHRIAIAQVLPDALDNSYGDRQQILQFAQNLAAEDVQLYYQTALVGRRDLPLASDPRTGFEMTLLRMLVFKPQGVVDVPTKQLPQEHVISSAAENHSASLEAAPEQIKKPQAAINETVPQDAPPARVTDDNQSQISQQIAQVKSHQPIKRHHQEPSTAINETKGSVGNANASSMVEVKAPTESAAKSAEKAATDEGLANHKQVQELTANTLADTAADSHPVQGNQADEGSGKQNAKPDRAAIMDSIAQMMTETAVDRKKSTAVTARDGGAKIDNKSHADGQETASPAANLANVANLALKDADDVSTAKIALESFAPHQWVDVYHQMKIRGIVQSTAANCVMVGREGNGIQFILNQDKTSLFDPSHGHRMADLLSDYFGQPVKVDIHLAAIPEGMETPSEHDQRVHKERYAQALDQLKADPVVQTLEREFGAVIQEETVKYPT